MYRGRARRAPPRTLVASPPVRIALTPRTSAFYDLFARAGANALEAARLAERRFRELPNPSVAQADVKAVEHVGDSITHDLVQLLNTQYVTPFDREDIYQLATAMDDVVDHIDEASDLLDLYGVDQPNHYALEQCRILVSAVEQLERALANLKGLRGVQDALVVVKRMEDEGDRVVRDAIGSLFKESRTDPLVVIRWKDIFEGLEDALDSCETAANVLANIVVKNA
jgi:predicted phosphate transport protein (TIGR00153 family)